MAVHPFLQAILDAAATDATSKAGLAYTTAVSQADTLAGTALSTAVSTAATDATTKDNALQVARDKAIREGMLPAAPRLVLAARTPLLLSASWQKIDLSSAGSLNTNLFPFITGTSGRRRVDWVPAEKALRFADADQNFVFQYDFSFAGGLRPADVFYRFVIPVPGAPLYFPHADGLQQDHLISMERLLTSPTTARITRPIYVGPELQQYGLQLELASTTALLTHPTVSSVDLFLFA